MVRLNKALPKTMPFRWILMLTLTFSVTCSLASDHLFFESKVRPILVNDCYDCHSETSGKQKGGLLLDRKAGWMAGGDSGASVLNLENPEESLLIKMVRRESDVEAMPPKHSLKASEVETLLEWVRRGAPDPRSEAMGKNAHGGFDLDARKQWWSLSPLKKVSPPEVKNKAWVKTAIDQFILKQLEEKSLSPARPADKATLLRRGSIALTGLAPTPAELDSFLNDSSEDAWKIQIDRLLDSPHFGERFARHWMDVVRYADSKSFEFDYTIPYGHEYRDYLIRVFNQDLPYDDFVRESLAGDLLEEPRINKELGLNESVIGPGGLLFTTGHHGPPDLHEDEARVFDGMINTATVAFQGLTVACAKCHDHKFDAITAADYYSIYGILRSSRLNYANISVIKDTHLATANQIKLLKKKYTDSIMEDALTESQNLNEWIDNAIELGKGKDQTERLANKKSIEEAPSYDAQMIDKWFDFLWSGRSVMELNHLRQALVKSPHSKNHKGLSTFKMDSRFKWKMEGSDFEKVMKPTFIVDVDHPSGIRAFLHDEMATGLSSGKLSAALRTEDFILDGEVIELWAKGHHAAVNLIVRNYELAGRGPVTKPLRVEINSNEWQKIRIPTGFWKGETAYIEVLQHGQSMQCVKSSTKVAAPNPKAWVAISTGVNGPRYNALFQNVKNADDLETLVIESLTGKFGNEGNTLIAAMISRGLIPVDADVGSSLKQQIRNLSKSIPDPRYVRSLSEGTNYDEPVYIRGNHKQPSKKNNPKHFLDAFGGQRIGKSGSGRLEYAEHLLTTSRQLTARVRVNRLWNRIFGKGIVSSQDDFGKMGSEPSHPELLDYLATKFIENNWSTKKLIREILLSSTYQMVNAKSLDQDPENTLLQHMPLQRMDAETLRDHILHVSGRMNRKLYGYGVFPNVSDVPRARGFPPNGPLDGKGRRSIYLQTRRNFLPSFQKAFNFPNPSEPIGRRQVTNVPAQSLTLLNHPFVHEQAKLWAQNLLENEENDDDRIQMIHRQAFSRDAQESERHWAKLALKEFRKDSSEEDAWASLCHIMMNRKEFLYVF